MNQYYEHLIGRYRFRFMDEHLNPLGLSGPLGFYLMRIHEYQSIKMNDLMIMTPYHKSHGTRMIQKLLDMGLIQKTADPTDLRGYILTTTPIGNERALTVIRVQKEWEELVHNALSDEENEALNRLTEKTYRYLQTYFKEDAST